MDQFIHLKSGFTINTDHISHIDFRRKEVLIGLGPSSLKIDNADDAAMLRGLFEPKPEPKPAPKEIPAPKPAASEPEPAK